VKKTTARDWLQFLSESNLERSRILPFSIIVDRSSNTKGQR